MVFALRFFSPFQNAVCFIILTYLVHVLFTFYIQDVLKLKKNSGSKRLIGRVPYNLLRFNIILWTNEQSKQLTLQTPNITFANKIPTPCLLRCKRVHLFFMSELHYKAPGNKTLSSSTKKYGSELTVVVYARAVQRQIKEPRRVSVHQDRRRPRPACPFRSVPFNIRTLLHHVARPCAARLPTQTHVSNRWIWNAVVTHQSLHLRIEKLKKIKWHQLVQRPCYTVNTYIRTVRQNCIYRCWSVRTFGNGHVRVRAGSQTLGINI